jgi:cytochrome c oxidase cbb3-type subunit 3
MQPDLRRVCVAYALAFTAAIVGVAARTSPPQSIRTPATTDAETYTAAQVSAGQALFAAQCGFCHGRDATGGQAGPDLTESQVVAGDVRGDKIGAVVRSGRADKGMPALNLSESDLAAVVAYIHSRKNTLDSQPGRRRRVSDADLISGNPNADAGRQFFNGAGGCSRCHSPNGDLAGIANRYRGLALLQQMLYPRRPTPAPGAAAAPEKPLPVRVSVTPANGAVITGALAYRDEFTIALTDANGWYRSWPTDKVKFTLTDPLQAHVNLLAEYTDADMHNVYAYLLTLQ